MGLFDDKIPLHLYKNTGTDWRLPENRMEAFARVYNTRMLEGDLDHWLSGKMICDYMGLDNEQKAWYCILFGFSYKNHWPMIVLQKFPRIWETDLAEITKWYNDSEGKEDGAWRRTYFNKDCKWNVRKFPDFIKSAQEWVGKNSLYEMIKELSTGGTTAQNFDTLNTALCKNLWGIGRMTSWLAIQTIYEFFDYDLNKPDLQLHDGGCWSQYEALCYIFNRSDLADKQTKESVILMEANTQKLIDYTNEHCKFHVDIFNFESCLCNFRKAAAQGKRKDYTFYASNELREYFAKIHEAWEKYEPGVIDWTPLILSITQRGPGASRIGWDETYLDVFSHTGLNFNTHYHYPDEPDPYEILDIPSPPECVQPKQLVKMLKEIDPAVVSKYKDKYDPLKHLRWK